MTQLLAHNQLLPHVTSYEPQTFVWHRLVTQVQLLGGIYADIRFPAYPTHNGDAQCKSSFMCGKVQLGSAEETAI
jgi:hypothetical protein